MEFALLNCSRVDGGVVVPFGLEFLKDHALGVVADRPGLDEAAQVELLGSEHGHFGGSCSSGAG